MGLRQILLLTLSTISYFPLSLQLSTNEVITIQVCQNKVCAKQYRKNGESLLETYQNLLLSGDEKRFQIESSGCLSECGKGPNVCLTEGKESGCIMNGVESPFDAAMSLRSSNYGYNAPASLIAACDLMAKANQFQSPEKKIKFLTSVISTLSNHHKVNEDDERLGRSHALVSALLKRADGYLQLPVPEPAKAVKDCQRAQEMEPHNGNVWKRTAEALEASGDTLGAIAAVSQWAELEIPLRSKANNEMMRLKAKL